MTKRLQQQCPGTFIGCPSCGKPVFSFDIREGHGFAMCQAKTSTGGERRNCGQHFFWVCSNRLCTVVAVSAEERQRYADGHFTSAEILHGLGLRGAA